MSRDLVQREGERSARSPFVCFSFWFRVVVYAHPFSAAPGASVVAVPDQQRVLTPAWLQGVSEAQAAVRFLPPGELQGSARSDFRAVLRVQDEEGVEPVGSRAALLGLGGLQARAPASLPA